VIFDDPERAARVSKALRTHTVDDTGWHVYSNMDQFNRHMGKLGRPHDLGAGWGIFIDSTDDEIEKAGVQFRQACSRAARLQAACKDAS
jgi:hypothetical protein